MDERFNLLRMIGTFAGVVLAVVSIASAGEADADAGLGREVRLLRAELDQLEADLKTIRRDAGRTWLDRRRHEELRRLVREVVADADGRASFANQTLTAGHDGDFYVASDDGRHRLEIGGDIQFRHVSNFRRRPDEGRATERGFELRRMRFAFEGHLFDPRLTFFVRTGFDRSDGTARVADLTFAYQLTEALELLVGRDKAPFLKEEVHSSTRQLAVERSAFNDVFTGARTTGVQLSHEHDRLRSHFQVNNGFRTGREGFQDNRRTARVGVTGRIEARLAGEWEQYDDFIAWADQPTGLFLGAAAHYESNRTARFDGAFADTLDFTSWTVDATAYHRPFSLLAAFAGRHDTRVRSDADRHVDLGLLLRGAWNVDDRLAPFAGYEWLIPDSDRTHDDGRPFHDIHLVTAGVNYYFHGHAAKLTTDVVWALNALNGLYTGSTGLGLLPDVPGQRRQVALRTQFQLLF